MTTLPLAAGLYFFDPIADERRARRETLTVVEQKMAETAAEAELARKAAEQAAESAAAKLSDLNTLRASSMDNEEDQAAVAPAQAAADQAVATSSKLQAEADLKQGEVTASQGLIETLRKTLVQIEKDADKRTLRPVYTLRIPNFRLQAQFEQRYYDVPVAPSDRKLWLAMKAAVNARGAEYGVTLDSADFQTLDKAFRESGSAKVPSTVVGLFEDLFSQTSESPEVRAVLKQRKAHANGLTLLRLRCYLAGIKGLPGADSFSVETSGSDAGLATEDSISLIPPSDIEAILEKLTELGTLRGREGNC